MNNYENICLKVLENNDKLYDIHIEIMKTHNSLSFFVANKNPDLYIDWMLHSGSIKEKTEGLAKVGNIVNGGCYE